MDSRMARQTPTIKSLVQGFAQHLKELKAPDYKESQVRLHYIDPFWKLLGWDVDNADQRAPAGCRGTGRAVDGHGRG